MQIESGKYYRMRSGGKAYVFGQSPFCSDWIGSSGDEDAMSWNPGGQYWPSKESLLDLIAPWQEPSQIKLPEKFDISTKSGGWYITVSQFVESHNQLINFCESLQAQITELKGKV